MKKIYDIAKENMLFQGLDPDDFDDLQRCLSAKAARYEKNDVILMAGEPVGFISLILSGSVKAIIEDINGHMTILAEFAASEIFGEVFACAGITQSPVTIQAAQDAEILFIDYGKIMSPGAAARPFQTKLIENMLKLIAQKNLFLNQKIEIISKRTTREKLLCFFDKQRGGSKRFSISMNREGLAHYLCVDRSAMSKELCKMRDEGMIKFKRNTFEIV